jgi:hypothetical protein
VLAGLSLPHTAFVAPVSFLRSKIRGVPSPRAATIRSQAWRGNEWVEGGCKQAERPMDSRDPAKEEWLSRWLRKGRAVVARGRRSGAGPSDRAHGIRAGRAVLAARRALRNGNSHGGFGCGSAVSNSRIYEGGSSLAGGEAEGRHLIKMRARHRAPRAAPVHQAARPRRPGTQPVPARPRASACSRSFSARPEARRASRWRL